MTLDGDKNAPDQNLGYPASRGSGGTKMRKDLSRGRRAGRWGDVACRLLRAMLVILPIPGMGGEGWLRGYQRVGPRASQP